MGLNVFQTPGFRSVRVMAPRAERVFLSSSESLNEGHRDKIYDQVSDAVLVGIDPFIDELSRVGSKGLILQRLRRTGPHQQAES